MEEKEFETPVPAEGDAQGQGRRLDPNAKGGKWKMPVLIAAIILAVLLTVYLIVCAVANHVAGQGKIFPGVTIAGVDVSGMTTSEQVVEAVAPQAGETANALEFAIQVNGQVIPVRGADAGLRVSKSNYAVANAMGASGGFLNRGWGYLTGLLGQKTELPCEYAITNEGYVDGIIAQAAAQLSGGVAETSWEVEESEDTAVLRLTCGVTGQRLDVEGLRAQLTGQLQIGSGQNIVADVTITPPAEPDFDKMAADVAQEPLDATLDVETDEVIPHRLGLKLDAAKAKTVYDGLEEGETGEVELEVTQPEVTTLELRATLFRDVLGEGTSKVGGNAARVNNVRLSAAACDGVILLPGQQMSYNQTTGQRTTAKGYREATGYTAKGQELMVGGGVCQPSSTLYMACLKANMEIVNRKNHMYTVSYMPEGVDATVSWPNLDYVFANNTKYPVKISMTIENRVLTARIYGTKTDENYVELESVRLSTTPAGISYEADPEIPRGTTRVIQGAHTGKKVEVYKKTFAADGTMLSREWISTDTYRPSNKIIAYNPLDGVPEAGIAPQPSTAPSPEPSTPVSEPPAESSAPPSSPVPEEPSAPPSVPPVEPSAPPSAPPADQQPPVQPSIPDVSAEPTLPPQETPAPPSAPPVEGIPME